MTNEKSETNSVKNEQTVFHNSNNNSNNNNNNNKEYVKIHDGLAEIIHQKLAEAVELIEEKCAYYKYTPANVLENENFKSYWNRSILTDKTIAFDRPDITFMNKKTQNTFSIDIAVPNTQNLAKTIIDEQNKYKELANEICAMWKQKAAQVIPIVVSSTGLIPKSLSHSLTRLNLHPNKYIYIYMYIYTAAKICNSWQISIVRNFLNYK